MKLRIIVREFNAIKKSFEKSGFRDRLSVRANEKPPEENDSWWVGLARHFFE